MVLTVEDLRARESKADVEMEEKLVERREAKQKIIEKNKAKNIRHASVYQHIYKVFDKFQLPVDKWGYFKVDGAHTVSELPAPRFRDEDFIIANSLEPYTLV